MDKQLDKTAQVTAEIITRRGIKETEIPADPKKFIVWNVMLLQQEKNKIDALLKGMAEDE